MNWQLLQNCTGNRTVCFMITVCMLSEYRNFGNKVYYIPVRKHYSATEAHCKVKDPFDVTELLTGTVLHCTGRVPVLYRYCTVLPGILYCTVSVVFRL